MSGLLLCSATKSVTPAMRIADIHLFVFITMYNQHRQIGANLRQKMTDRALL
jgi:hypothetical protein